MPKRGRPKSANTKYPAPAPGYIEPKLTVDQDARSTLRAKICNPVSPSTPAVFIAPKPRVVVGPSKQEVVIDLSDEEQRVEPKAVRAILLCGPDGVWLHNKPQSQVENDDRAFYASLDGVFD